ncbi:MAG: GNAT family N-acetyltransferase [Alphaproteobacteria bacterium]|nr:GNAT family N-acetyltransferase [Alphaproteobacteria bacterium]
MKQIQFKIIKHDSPEYMAGIRLSEDILRKPLGLSFSQEELEKEKHYIQIAGFIEDRVVATAVLIPEGEVLKMRRVVVKEDLQQQGIASALVRFCETYALKNGFKEIYCHARSTAVPFYMKNYYGIEGEYFNENTIPHIKMRKFLWNIIPATQTEIDLVDDKLGEFNRNQVPATQEPTLVLKNYIIKDAETIIAGIKSDIYHWGILYVEVLFVDEKYRGQHLGSALLQRVEREAKAIEATLSHTDTFDFQALDFYLKHGYEIFGILEDCPKDHKRYYLKKIL